jgi:hypothetical protein
MPMAHDVAGSIRKCSIDGIPYRVMSDANITEIVSKYENSMIPTSSKNMRKMTKRVLEREGLVLAVNGSEKAQIKAQAESLDDLKLFYEVASGDKYRAVGSIEIENHETEENRMTCKLLPNDDWTPVING